VTDSTPLGPVITAPSNPNQPALPLLLHADQELRRIRIEMPQLLELFKTTILAGPGPAVLLRYGEPHKVVRLTDVEVGVIDQWFFIGDIHGDFFALHSLLREAESRHDDARVLFLGDLVDRGDMPFECLFLLLDWGLRRPGRLGWIAGNHDIAFSVTAQGAFQSLVSPAELLDVINRDDLFSGFRRELGEFFVMLTQGLPRALLFPDGLLATHGGIPLVDLHPQGAAIDNEAAYLDWLNCPACLKDFTWTRIHRAPKKLPDRYSTGAQYGFRDFEAFAQLKPEWFPVMRMVNGHEHPKGGFNPQDTYVTKPALTLLGLGFDELRPMPDRYAHYTEAIHLGQGVPDALPSVIPVPVVREQLEMMYGELAAKPVADPAHIATTPQVKMASQPAATLASDETLVNPGAAPDPLVRLIRL
jgi:hypothetical protein